MSSGISTAGQMSLQELMQLYQPTVLPQAFLVQASRLAALGQSDHPAQQQGQGQRQEQQGGSLASLRQLAQLGGSGTTAASGQAQPGQGGLQQVLINAMNANGPNGNSDALANAVGFTPFGTGSFG
jgi:hypothetical protein